MNGKRKSAAPDAQPRVSVNRLAGAWSRSLPGYAARIEAWAGAALPVRERRVVSIVLADDAMLRDLNHQFRGKDKPTNVLSFTGDGEELGDVILAYETIRREAKEQKKSFARHAAHLVIHGCLHLQGHDHEEPAGRAAMEAKEIAILAGFGLPNPYEPVP